MSETKKADNPFAFSSTANKNSDTEYEKGMTLRDYFAAKAMQGLMSMEEKGEYKTINDAWNKIAEYSYQMADAMLKQRELNNENQ